MNTTFSSFPQQAPSSGANSEDRIDLAALISLIWRRKWLIVAATILGMVLAYLAVSQITPKFTARATIMLDSRTVQILSTDDVVSDLTLSNSVLDTEVAVLRSNTLLRAVVEDIPAETLAIYDPANAAPSFLQRVFGSNGQQEDSVDVSPEAAEALRVRRLVGAMRNDMQVWRDGQSYIIGISFTTQDPGLSALLANRVAETYINRQIEERSVIIQGATDFLRLRSEELQLALEQAETAVEEFRSTQLDEIGVTPGMLERQLADLSTQFSVARADLAIATSRLQQITGVIDTQGIEVASELLSSPLVLALREELLSLRRDDARLSTSFGPEHPDRLALRATMELLSADLEAEVRKVIANLRSEVEIGRIRADSLQASMVETEERAAELSKASLRLRQLEREASAVRSNFEAVLERLNETRSVQLLQRANARVVEQAQAPRFPSEPRVRLFTALGATLGFMIGFVLVTVSVLTSEGFRRAADLETALGLPVLVSIPLERWTNLQGMLASMKARGMQVFSERLRLLRAGLGLRSSDVPIKRIMVTSAVPAEGKTSTVVALAQTEAQARRRAVIVEFDTRRASIARELGYQPKLGDLPGLLRGMCDLDDAIYEVSEYGFDLISAKKPDPQVLDRAMPDAIKAMFDDLGERYDTVIIDTGPISFVADTLVIAQYADVVVLVVKQGTTQRREVVEAAKNLRETGCRSIVVAMTMADPRDVQSAYGRYGVYGYGDA
ncbi:MAG: polysaccharide biosynthesis tyrosine autokinase [Pseudomonadota bacterium]